MGKKVVKIPKTLSIFTLAMINIAAIGSVKNWPFTAEYGFASLFYFILAALVFFFPVSFVSAELATGWPKKGGIYLWVKEAFGPAWGFLAVWLQWIENVVWYPTVLSFAASSLAYTFNPNFATNVPYTITVVLILFWGATITNLFGMKASGLVSNLGAICGNILPGLIIITLGSIWIIEGSPLQISFSWDTFFPSFDLSHMVFFVGVLLAFSGMEMSAVHVLDVEHPKRNYPRAIFLSVALILSLSIFSVLSIAVVIPHGQISFTAGAMQAFSIFLNRYDLGDFIPVVAALIGIGLFGSVSTWIIGPPKGLLAAGQEGNLPSLFHRVNKRQAPVALLMTQGIIVSILSLLFILMPTISSGFWILTVLVAQLYLIMYIVMFLAALRLRYTKPHVIREYRVPCGVLGMWIICVIGIIGSTFALFIGYIPPTQIPIGSPSFYTGFLIVGTFLGCIAPFLIRLFKKPHWDISNQPPSSKS